MHRFRVEFGNDESSRIAEVFQLHVGRSLRDGLQDLYDDARDSRIEADAVVVRLPVGSSFDPADLADVFAGGGSGHKPQLFAPHDAAIVFARSSDRSVHILSSLQGQPVISSNVNPLHSRDALHEAGVTAEEAVTKIRAAEFGHLLNQSRAVLTSPADTAFRAPSGRLVVNFVRVGNLQYDRDAIDAVSYWLLPHLRDCAAILTDTWSISSIALNAARVAQAHFGGAPRFVEFLPDYLDGTPASSSRARGILERLVLETRLGVGGTGDSEVLCLVSATQSGSMRRAMGDIAPLHLDGLRQRFVAIIALGDTSMDSLHDLSGDPRFKILADGTAAPASRIPIDPKVYFPLLFKDEEVILDKAGASASKTEIDALANHGIFQVHRTVGTATGTKHQAIHIDTERLLQAPDFVASFDKLIDGLSAHQSLVVAPDEPGCRNLAEHAVRRLRLRAGHPKLLFHHSLHIDTRGGAQPVEAGVIKFISQATEKDEITVIVDCWQEDASLTPYEKALRTQEFKGKVNYIVGVARPEHEASWHRIVKRMGASRHAVKAACVLPLPNWGDDECPWCAELRLYQRWQAAGLLPTPLADRMRHLAVLDRGLVDHIFLDIPEFPDIELGPRSFFVQRESSQADAFAAACSALARLRTRDPSVGIRLGPRRFPITTVLKCVDYLRDTWTDTVLRACLLRGAITDELVFADAGMEAERTRLVRDLITARSTADHDIAPELLIAKALGKVPLTIDDALRTDLSLIDGKGLLAGMLDAIVADGAANRR